MIKQFTLEALVAEMGANYLSSLMGQEGQVIEAEELFMKTWIEAFTYDKYLLLKAGTIAQKAVYFIIVDGVKSEVQKP